MKPTHDEEGQSFGDLPPMVSSPHLFQDHQKGNESEVSTGDDPSFSLKGTQDDLPSEGFIRLAPRTHDVSSAEEHIESVNHLASDLEAAVKAVWPRRHESRYSQVHVLLLRWEDDDLGVATEIKDLWHVLEDLYHFQIQSFHIPSLKPDKALKREIIEFLKNDGEDSLLILYYTGHARHRFQSNESPMWIANRHATSPSLPSGGIQSMLEEADSDVLLLYDCCHSAASKMSQDFQGNVGVTEVIAACGYETVAPQVDKHSFSKALTETLAASSQGPPFSAGELHTRVLDRLRCWTPALYRDSDDKFVKNPDGRLAYELQPRRTPVYSIICETEPRRSILLAPLKTTSSLSKTPSMSPGSSTQTSSTGFSSRNPFRESVSSVGSEIIAPQILLAIRLKTTEVNINAVRDCLRLLPPECEDIKIEGAYRSWSTLILLRMPVAIWNLLPENPAYSFVGYLTSENMAINPMQNKIEVPVSTPLIAKKTAPLLNQSPSPSIGNVHSRRDLKGKAVTTIPRSSFQSTAPASLGAGRRRTRRPPLSREVVISYRDDKNAATSFIRDGETTDTNKPSQVKGLASESPSHADQLLHSNHPFITKRGISPPSDGDSSSFHSASASERSKSTARTSFQEGNSLGDVPESLDDYYNSFITSTLRKKVIVHNRKLKRYDPEEPRSSDARPMERESSQPRSRRASRYSPQ